MDEMNNTAGYTDAELDSDWDLDEDSGIETADEAQTPEADQPVGEQQPADQPTATDTTTDPAQQEDAQPADQPQLIDIVYRGQKEQLTVEQARPLIQMGRDYPTVRAERDQLKAEAQTNAAAVNLVKGYAQRMGMDVPQYLEWVRTQELLKTGLNEQQAAQTIQMEKRQAALNAQEARFRAQQMQQAQQNSVQQRQRAQAEARRRGMEEFRKAYPEVKATDIPPEVWGKVAQGVPMLSAYAMHENAQLKAQLAAERQNKINQQRSPGGLGANSGLELDEIDRDWAEED